MGNLRICRYTQQRPGFTGVTFDFRSGVDGIKTDTKTEVLIKAVRRTDVKVTGHQVGFTGVTACGITVIKFGGQAIIAGDRGADPPLIVNWLHIVNIGNPLGWRNIIRIEAVAGITLTRNIDIGIDKYGANTKLWTIH